jgi:pectate lyase
MPKNYLLLTLLFLFQNQSIAQNVNSYHAENAFFFKTKVETKASEFDSIYRFENSPIGFASVDTLGQNGTTGGEGGDTIVVKTGEELFQILDVRRDPHFNKNNPALVILIEGKLTWNTKEMMDVKETYDLTILGKGTDAQIEGFGLNVFRSHNIIIRNIEFRDAPDDAVNVTNELSHHIWIDHCTLSDDPAIDPSASNHDGLIDIKDGASYITVSWNHFRNHHKTCLLGHSDNNGATDIGKLKVTYHHNWFDNTNSRHPRVRFGEVHVFNNYYDNSSKGMSYGIASTMEADVVVESNYFKNVPHPTYVGYGDSGPGDLIENNNIYENSGEPEIRGTAFDPTTYYSYQPDSTLQLPDLLMKYSGSGKLNYDPTSILKHIPESRPLNFVLFQNYPNPFNSTTFIRYQVAKAGIVILNVYDMLGREIAQLINEEKTPGEYSIKFDANTLATGLYIYQMRVGDQLVKRKMLMLK